MSCHRQTAALAFAMEKFPHLPRAVVPMGEKFLDNAGELLEILRTDEETLLRPVDKFFIQIQEAIPYGTQGTIRLDYTHSTPNGDVEPGSFILLGKFEREDLTVLLTALGWNTQTQTGFDPDRLDIPSLIAKHHPRHIPAKDDPGHCLHRITWYDVGFQYPPFPSRCWKNVKPLYLATIGR